MKRILAWMCLSFLAAETAAAFLGQTVILPVLGAAAAFALLSRKNAQARFYFLLAAAMLAGSLWSNRYTAGNIKTAGELNGRTVTAIAEVKSAVPAYGDTAYGTLLLTEIDGQKQKALVSCYGFPAVKPGQRFRASFALSRVDKNALSQYADGIFLSAEYQGDFSDEKPGKGIPALFARLRMALSDSLMNVMGAEEGALACAMVLGDKSRLTAELRSVFSRAGASHMLVVSGMHLAMLCGLLSGLMQLNRFSGKRAVLMAVVSLAVSALVGFTVSVIRASAVILLSCFGALFVRKTDTLTSLSFAAFLICLHCPYAMFDVGFQLTFGATIGVVAANKVYYYYRHTVRKTPVPPEKRKTLMLRFQHLTESVLTALMMGGFAAIFTAPFLLWHRMGVSGVSMLSSVLAMVFLPGILLLGGITAVVSLLGFSRLSSLLAGLLQLLVNALLIGMKALGGLPISRLALPREFTIYALLVIAAWTIIMVQRNRLKHLTGKVVLLLLLACLIGTVFGRNVIEIEEFGNASAPCILVTRNDHNLLVYRGGKSNRARLQRVLDYRGLSQPELVIDLRQSGSSEPPESETVLAAMDMEKPVQGKFTEDISYYVLPERKGIIVLLDVGGFRAAVTAGELKKNRDIPADLYFAAGRNAYQIHSEKIIIAHDSYTWLEDSPGNVWYGANPVVAIRPGKNILYKGVKRLAVQ